MVKWKTIQRRWARADYIVAEGEIAYDLVGVERFVIHAACGKDKSIGIFVSSKQALHTKARACTTIGSQNI